MSVSPVRCLTVWLTATAGTVALVVWLLSGLDLGTPVRFDQALTWLAAAAGSVTATWLWVVSTVVVLEAATGGTRASRGVPARVRRLVLTACGAAVLAGLAAPASATPGDLHRDRLQVASLAGLPFPDRAVGARHAPPPEADVVVVRPGDTLWDLARADLGPGADPAAVDARWREIYQHNRAVIGPDPDLIQPAQRLRLPAHR